MISPCRFKFRLVIVKDQSTRLFPISRSIQIKFMLFCWPIFYNLKSPINENPQLCSLQEVCKALLIFYVNICFFKLRADNPLFFNPAPSIGNTDHSLFNTLLEKKSVCVENPKLDFDPLRAPKHPFQGYGLLNSPPASSENWLLYSPFLQHCVLTAISANSCQQIVEFA